MYRTKTIGKNEFLGMMSEEFKKHDITFISCDKTLYNIAKTFKETELHNTFVVNAAAEGGYSFGQTAAEAAASRHPEKLIESFFAAVAVHLSKRKKMSEDNPVVFELQDVAGKFKFAAIVQYHENQSNPDDPGNWSLEFTLDENDVTELEEEENKKVTKLLFSEAFRNDFCDVVRDIGFIRFTELSFVYPTALLVVNSLLQVIDREAVDGETVEIDYPNYFKVTIEVVDGKKEFSITPSGYLKAIIKDDTAISK